MKTNNRSIVFVIDYILMKLVSYQSNSQGQMKCSNCVLQLYFLCNISLQSTTASFGFPKKKSFDKRIGYISFFSRGYTKDCQNKSHPNEKEPTLRLKDTFVGQNYLAAEKMRRQNIQPVRSFWLKFFTDKYGSLPLRPKQKEKFFKNTNSRTGVGL